MRDFSGKLLISSGEHALQEQAYSLPRDVGPSRPGLLFCHPILIPYNISTASPGLLSGLCEPYLPVARRRKDRIKSSRMTILAVLQPTPLSCLEMPREGHPRDNEQKREQ